MTDYYFEEHKCPACEHQFVVEMTGLRFLLKGSDEVFLLTKCPKCEERLYVTGKYKYGCLADLIPEKDAKVVSASGY